MSEWKVNELILAKSISREERKDIKEIEPNKGHYAIMFQLETAKITYDQACDVAQYIAELKLILPNKLRDLVDEIYTYDLEEIEGGE